MTEAKLLRKFAFALSALLLLFLEGFPYIKRRHFLLWPWWIIGTLVILALVRPLWLKPLHRVWIGLGETLGFINSRIVLGLFYFLFFTPLATLARLMGKDRMKRKYEPNKSSYRIQRTSKIEKSDMEQMF